MASGISTLYNDLYRFNIIVSFWQLLYRILAYIPAAWPEINFCYFLYIYLPQSVPPSFPPSLLAKESNAL